MISGWLFSQNSDGSVYLAAGAFHQTEGAAYSFSYDPDASGDFVSVGNLDSLCGFGCQESI